MVDSEDSPSGNGQLGTMASSARYKCDIRDMGDASARLMKLRPVTFRYRDDPTGTIQYGLVPEEVARVYPELVTYSADGKVETVRYSELTGLLLNELQKQTNENARQAERLRSLQDRLASVNNLAGLLDSKGEYARAELLYGPRVRSQPNACRAMTIP